MSGRFNLADYVPVQERINLFWKDHPEGRIITTLESDPADFSTCRYRAELYIDADQQRPSATGWAFEIAGGGMANKTSHEENCETSAIGRALANLGYATSQKDRPSREEMHKASSDAPQGRQQRDTRRYAHVAPDAPQAATARQDVDDVTQPAMSSQLTKLFDLGRELDIYVKKYVKDNFGGRDVNSLTYAEAELLIEQWQTEVADLAGVS